MKILDFHKISNVLVSIDTVIVGVAGSHVSLQIIDFQYFKRTFLNQIPIWTLDKNSSLRT